MPDNSVVEQTLHYFIPDHFDIGYCSSCGQSKGSDVHIKRTS